MKTMRLLCPPRLAAPLRQALLLGALIVPAAQAQSLSEAMTNAFEHHPALAAQHAALRALEHDAEAARGGWRPQVQLNASAGHYSSASELKAPPGTLRSERSSADVRLTATQPLFNGTTGPMVSAAEARVRQGEAELQATEQAVMLDVASAYLNVLQGRQLLVLNQVNERGLARQVEYREEYFERKLGTRTELAQAQARHAVALAQLNRVQVDLESVGHAFLRQVGAPPGELHFPDRLPPLPARLDALLDEVEQVRPAVLSARMAMQAARADVDAVRGKLQPSLALEASGGWASAPADGLRGQRDAALRLTLRIPLYEGGVLRAQVAGSSERAAQQQLRWDDARLQARQDAADAWRRLAAARTEVAAYDTAIAANRVAAQGVRELHDTLGELTLIDVLNAQQELFQAETGRVQARTQAALAHLSLLAILGQLRPQGVAMEAAVTLSDAEPGAATGVSW